VSEPDFCRWDGADLIIEIRVIANAKRTGLAGIRGGRLLVRLQARPVDGKADAALQSLLAQVCGVSRGAVRIERGESARDKSVRIERPGTLPAFE